jgi:hypothetical protein
LKLPAETTPEKEDAMSLEFNEKGKYFTDIISKAAVSATIQTVMHRIEGFVHIRLGERVKNELDRNEPFLAVTSAKVFGPDGVVLYETDFMTVARAQIIWVIPNESGDTTGDQQ